MVTIGLGGAIAHSFSPPLYAAPLTRRNRLAPVDSLMILDPFFGLRKQTRRIVLLRILKDGF